MDQRSRARATVTLLAALGYVTVWAIGYWLVGRIFGAWHGGRPPLVVETTGVVLAAGLGAGGERLLGIAPASVGPRRICGSVLQGIALGLLWVTLTLVSIALFAHVRPAWSFGKSEPVVTAIAFAGLNASLQEFVVRGFVYSALRRHGAAIAIIATTSFFALLHAGAAASQTFAWINLIVAGGVFAIARDRTRTLALPVSLHVTWNVLIGPVLGLVVSRETVLNSGAHLLEISGHPWLTGGAFGIEASIVTTLTTVLLGVVVVRQNPRPAT
jgi:membrane protease YdiL (CAAX protease family)